MLRTIKGTLTAVMLSSVAVAPLATAAFVGTADMAIAKSENAGGKGKGKGGVLVLQQQPGGSKGKSGGGGGKALGKLDSFLSKVTGKSSGKSRGGLSKDDPMHPSNLGNMNGAFNANENAIAAHLRNGNTNGPVGLMAAYVSARATTAAEYETLGEGAEYYSDLNNFLSEYEYFGEDGNPDLETYLVSGETNPEVEAVLERIHWSDRDRMLYEKGYVDDDGNPDYSKYLEALVADAQMEPDLALEDASTDPNTFDDGLYADVTASGDALGAEDDAAQALIDYWNKQDTAPEGSEETLREALEARAMELEETGVVQDALSEPDVMGSVACEEGDTECVPEEELASTTD